MDFLTISLSHMFAFNTQFNTSDMLRWHGSAPKKRETCSYSRMRIVNTEKWTMMGNEVQNRPAALEEAG